MARPIIAFDLDGTLIEPAGGRAQLEAARLFLRHGPHPRVLEGNNLTHRGTAELLVGRRLTPLEHYRYRMAYRLALDAEPIIPRDGAVELLLALSPRADLYLLTGNCEDGAWEKVSKAGIAQFFKGGAFGDRVRTKQGVLGEFLAEHGHIHVIVGDTPVDMRLAKNCGCRGVAVPYGNRYTHAELRAAGARKIIDDLAETQGAVDAILNQRTRHAPQR